MISALTWVQIIIISSRLLVTDSFLPSLPSLIHCPHCSLRHFSKNPTPSYWSSPIDLKIRYSQIFSDIRLEESFILPELWSSDSRKPPVEQASINWGVSMFLISIMAVSTPRFSPIPHKHAHFLVCQLYHKLQNASWVTLGIYKG